MQKLDPDVQGKIRNIISQLESLIGDVNQEKANIVYIFVDQGKNPWSGICVLKEFGSKIMRLIYHWDLPEEYRTDKDIEAISLKSVFAAENSIFLQLNSPPLIIRTDRVDLFENLDSKRGDDLDTLRVALLDLIKKREIKVELVSKIEVEKYKGEFAW